VNEEDSNPERNARYASVSTSAACATCSALYPSRAVFRSEHRANST